LMLIATHFLERKLILMTTLKTLVFAV